VLCINEAIDQRVSCFSFDGWKANQKSHQITHDLSRRSSLRREIPQKVDAQINIANWSRSSFALRFGATLFRRTRSASLSITLTAATLGIVIPQQQATAHAALNPNILGNLGSLPQPDQAGDALSSPIPQTTLWQVETVSSLQAPATFSTTPNVLAALVTNSPSQANLAGTQTMGIVSTGSAVDLSVAVVQPSAEDLSQASEMGKLVHTVEKGENLTEIADKYQVSPASIAKTNRIPNPNVIDVNEDLVIPATTLSATTNNVVAATALTQSIEGKQPSGQTAEGLTNAKMVLASRANKIQNAPEYASRASDIARRSIFSPMPSLELPPLSASAAGQFLPAMVQNGVQKFIWPANGVFTSGYGWRWGRMHRGIDIAAPVGTPVVASASGVVVSAGWNDGGFGNLVEIRHPDGTVTRYAHNQTVSTRIGTVVNQGELIAHMGSTGRSTGPHTHFEIRLSGQGSIDPMTLLARK
jgi:murein DD-endopeptidase MepM/ murein hydrolase activator NlpD